MRPNLEACLSLSAAFLPKGHCQKEVFRLFPPLPDGKPDVPIEDDIAVSQSLGEFAETINHLGTARQLVQAHAKNSATLPKVDNFYVITRQGLDHQAVDDNHHKLFPYPVRSFYQDGRHGLALMWKTTRSKNSSWLEVVSFSSSQRIKWYNRDDNPLTHLTFPEPPAPVIVQIQGYPTGEKEVPNRIKTKILALQQNFFIDIALVELLIEWCVRNRLPTLYMLPASMNKYLKGDLKEGSPEYEKRKKRFETRYDGVARHFGFTLQPNGLWRFDLRPIRIAKDA